MEIKRITEGKELYMDLLLIGDESIDMIKRYIHGDMFGIFTGNKLKCIAVVTTDDGLCELKNIATLPAEQGRGYASTMISYLEDHYRGRFSTIYLGTGNSPFHINFYTKRGFEHSHTIKDFFTDNYPVPIIENGVRITDMIYMKKSL